MSNYNNESIQTLHPLEAIRERLPMYAGGKDNNALHHVLKEIISNSIDEYLSGYGKKIHITVNEKENKVMIEDEARGIPFGKLEDAFTIPHTTGKMKSRNKESYAGSTGGLNGIGIKIATATGKVEVESHREGECMKQTFHFMNKTDAVVSKSKKTGTIVSYKPDSGVFTDNQIRYDRLFDLIDEMSYLLPELTFIMKKGDKVEKIKGKGIEQFIQDYYNNIFSPVMTIKEKTDTMWIELSMAWSEGSEDITSFVNLIPTADGGTHITAFKTTFTRMFNKEFNADLTGAELRRGWKMLISLHLVEEPDFKGQSKDALNMNSINPQLNELYKSGLEQLFIQEKEFFEKLKENVEKQRKKEEALSKIHSMLAKSSKANKTSNPAPNKLKPALNKKGLELVIGEGDSAIGSLIPHRNIYTQAILGLRGKPLNVVKREMVDILENEEIQDLIKVLGSFKENFSAKTCAYDKIIIATDADPDGSHIQILLLAFFMEFYPKLVENGNIYIAKTPLFIIKNGLKKEFLYSHEEMDKRRKTIPKTAVVSYLKGLGELNSDVLADCVLTDKRKLVQISMSNKEETIQKIEDYMGQDAEIRRILARGEE